MPQSPAPPPGATSITINWNWSCPTVAPPQLTAQSTTICVACNIAIAVRVGSAGNTGAVTQVTGALAAAASGNSAAVAQTVTQAVTQAVDPPLTAPPPSAIVLPPPAVVPAPPAAVVPPLPAVIPPAVAEVVPQVIPPALPAVAADDPFVAVAAAGSPDDAPRHGAPAFPSGSGGEPPASSSVGDRAAVETRAVLPVRVLWPVAVAVAVEPEPAHAAAAVPRRSAPSPSAHTGGAAAPPSAPPRGPAPPAAPFAPVSAGASAPLESGHGLGAATVALWLGGLSLAGLGFFLVIALLEAWASGAMARAQPDPPG